MKHPFFFEHQDLASQKLPKNPEQRYDTNEVAEKTKLDRLKNEITKAIQDFIDNFSMFKSKKGKERAINYKAEIEGFEGNVTTLIDKLFDDIKKPIGVKPLETSIDLRDKLTQTLSHYLKVPEKEITRRLNEDLIMSGGSMYTDSLVIIEQTRRRITLDLIQKAVTKLHNVEMVELNPRRLT